MDGLDFKIFNLDMLEERWGHTQKLAPYVSSLLIMGIQLLGIMMTLYDTLVHMMIMMILYDTLLADDGSHLNNPLGRGMESMIVSRTKVDHCLQNCNNDDVDGEDDMNDGGCDDVQVEDLEKDGRDLVEASCPASECWGCSA